MLELINRARANPPLEGVRLRATTDADVLDAYAYFRVDLDAMAAQFASYPARPPLAFNPDLIAAARRHSQDMVARGFQGHTGSDGFSMAQRINATGYTAWSAAAENVFAYAESVFHGHAGFNADWGVPSLGHRMNIMNFSASGPVYSEIGIGIVSVTSSHTAVGPLVVTENFGRRGGHLFVVGVAYRDRDHDGFYSVGEGIPGVIVSTSQGNYAITSASGGYAIPLAGGAGSVSVRAEGTAWGAAQEFSVAWSATNVKVDFVADVRSEQSSVIGDGSRAAVAVVEYFHAQFGHYFITAHADEIAALDAGVFTGWARTGHGFDAYRLGARDASSVCRFFTTAFAPKSSHFYTPFTAECAAVKANRDWQFEAEVFALIVPDADGNCGAGTAPLFRLYNGGRTGAPNHRYTTSLAVRNEMVAQGYIAEGRGDLGVIGCVPP